MPEVRHLSPATLPALGDVRAMGTGDRLYISRDMRTHQQWGRYSQAIGDAVSRGASVRWTTGDGDR